MGTPRETAKGHIDNLALAKAERRLSEYIAQAIAAPDGRTEVKGLPPFIEKELQWLHKATEENLPAVGTDAMLTIAAACLCCHARILTEAGDV